MDVSISKEFIKIYELISKLLKDITEIGKDCYDASSESCDAIEVPSSLSQLDNDMEFVTIRDVNERLQDLLSQTDLLYLKRYGEGELDCLIPTTFEDLHTTTKEDDDSSDSVATTEFVHNIVTKSSENTVLCLIGKIDTSNFVTSDQLDIRVDNKIAENDKQDEQMMDDKINIAVQQLDERIDAIKVPEKTSQLINDSGFITINDVPGDLVTSVNGQTGNVVIDIPTVPTNISAFNNDAGYITDPGVTSVNNRTGAVTIQENVQADWTSLSGPSSILNKPALKRIATTADYGDLENTPTNVSSFTNDAGYLTSFTETDPIFTASDAYGITSSDITNWNNKQNKIVAVTTIGSLYRNNVSGSGNISISGTSGQFPRVNAAGTYTVVTNMSSLTQSYGLTITFGGNTYTLNTTNGVIEDSREVTVPAGATWGATVVGSVAGNTILSEKINSGAQEVTTLHTVAITGDYNDLLNRPSIPAAQVLSNWNETNTSSKAYIQNKPTIPTKTSQLTNDSGYTTNIGTITGITMNGASKGTSGVVDLGTVITAHQDISGKENTTNKVTSVSSSSTDTQYPSAKAVANYVDANAKIFWGIVEETTFSEIEAAFNEGKLILLKDSVNEGYIYCLSGFGGDSFTFSSAYSDDNLIETIYVDQNDTWNYFETPVPYYYADSAEPGGSAKQTEAIPFGRVDSTSTSTAFTATVPGITELKDGTCVLLKNGVVTSAAGYTININGLGAKPTFSNLTAATRDTTIFNVNYTMLFIYDSTRVVDNITGAWCCYRGYDANTNTIGYQLRTNSYSKPMANITYRYRLLFSSANNEKWVPANTSTSTNATASRTVNQTPINPFGEIVYYGTTASVAADSRPSVSALWQQYTLSLGYSFNRTGAALTLTSWKPVYVKCAPQADGSAIIDSTTPYVQALPTTDDGKIYIFLGVAYSATAIELTMNHPVFYYKDGGIREWTNAVTSSGGGTSKLAVKLIDGDNITDSNIVAQWIQMQNDFESAYTGSYRTPDPFDYFEWSKYTPSNNPIWSIPQLEIERGTIDGVTVYKIRPWIISTNGIRKSDWVWYYDSSSNIINTYYDD